MRTQKTLRRLPPETRKLARYLNDVERSISRLNRLLPRIADVERETIAWQTRQDSFRKRGEVDPLTLDPVDRSVLAKVTKDLW